VSGVGVVCVLCARTLLAGERVRLFTGERSREQTVCGLCESEAVSRRWLRAETVETVHVNGGSQTVRKVA
jgi:hypothetical protein